MSRCMTSERVIFTRRSGRRPWRRLTDYPRSIPHLLEIDFAKITRSSREGQSYWLFAEGVGGCRAMDGSAVLAGDSAEASFHGGFRQREEGHATR